MTSILVITVLLGLPALLSLWALVTDLRGERRAGIAASSRLPRSRPDEQQTRSEMLALVSR
jgi:hypothetical protein